MFQASDKNALLYLKLRLLVSLSFKYNSIKHYKARFNRVWAWTIILGYNGHNALKLGEFDPLIKSTNDIKFSSNFCQTLCLENMAGDKWAILCKAMFLFAREFGLSSNFLYLSLGRSATWQCRNKTHWYSNFRSNLEKKFCSHATNQPSVSILIFE